MNGLVPFVRENGAGVGTLTVYTGAALYYFFVHQSESVYFQLILLFSIAPAVFVYEITKEFTDLIIKKTLEQHIAIVRAQLELEHGGEFDDWYEGDAIDRIDDLDRNSRQEITTILCSAIIGLTAPFLGFFAFGFLGLWLGVGVLVASIFTVLYAFRKVVQSINRTPKVVKS